MPNYNMVIKYKFMKKCCVIGHRKIIETPTLICDIEKTIIRLIKDENVYMFLLGSKSAFTDLCYDVITEVKNKYNHIKRVYVRAEYPIISDRYESYLKRFYEDSYYYNDKQISGKYNYVKRNQVMIDSSNYCLFYYNSNYNVEKTKSGTQLAYEYAVNKKKNIINLYV